MTIEEAAKELAPSTGRAGDYNQGSEGPKGQVNRFPWVTLWEIRPQNPSLRGLLRKILGELMREIQWKSWPQGTPRDIPRNILGEILKEMLEDIMQEIARKIPLKILRCTREILGAFLGVILRWEILGETSV